MAIKSIFLKTAFISAESGIFITSAKSPKQPQSMSIPLIITDKMAHANNAFKQASSRELVLYKMPNIKNSPSRNSSHGTYIAKNGIIISGNNWNSLNVRINLIGSEIFARPANKKIPPIINLNIKETAAAISGYINRLIIMTPLFYKIPPNLPLPKGGIIPLFGKEGMGEIF